MFVFRRQGRDHREINLICLKKNLVNMADLHKVRLLFHVIVKWEKYRPHKRDTTQCGSCITFGHGTNNFQMLPQVASNSQVLWQLR